MHTHFTVECRKMDKVTGWMHPSEWTYVSHIETAEYIANTHSAKNGRKYVYVAVVMASDMIVRNTDGKYVPLKVGESSGGVMVYSPEWIAETTVSAMVDGVKHSVTLA